MLYVTVYDSCDREIAWFRFECGSQEEIDILLDEIKSKYPSKYYSCWTSFQPIGDENAKRDFTLSC